MATTVLKVGNPLSEVNYRFQGLKWSRAVNGGKDATFARKHSSASSVHAEGSPVRIEVGGTAVFDGIITKVEQEDPRATGVRNVVYKCADNTIWLRDRIVSETTWESGTAIEAIFAEIVTDYLSSDGFTDNSMSGGPSLSNDLTVKDIKVIELFDQLRDTAIDEGGQEYFWRVSPTKQVEFNVRGASSAAWDIPNGSGASPIDVQGYVGDRSQYRNSFLIRGAKDGTGEFTETFTAGGATGDTTVNIAQRRFSVNRPIVYVVGVEVNSVPFTVGRNGNGGPDLTADFIYTPGDRVVLAVRPVIEVGDTVEITYVARREIRATYTDSAEVSARAAVEGGSGKYERTIDDQRIRTQEIAETIARAATDVFAQIPQVLKYTTHDEGLLPGDEQTISISNLDISSTVFFITEIAGTVDKRQEAKFTITATSGFALNRWQATFRTLLAQQGAPPDEDNIDQKRNRIYYEELVADSFLLFDNGTEVVPDGGTQSKKFRYEPGSINPFG